MSIKCLYCPAILSPHTKPEHILLRALGGRKKSRRIACNKCNGELGSTIDKDISEQLSPISNLLNIIRDNKKPPPTLRNLDFGRDYKIDLSAGGRPVISKASVQTKKEGENIRIQISSQDEERLKKLLEGQLKRFGKTIKDVKVAQVERHEEYGNKPIRLSLSLGSQEHFRSIAKMLFNYLAIKIDPSLVRSPSFDKIRLFIKEGKYTNENLVNHDYHHSFPEISGIHQSGEVAHRLMVFTDGKEGIAYGLLELFGHIRFSALLSDQWKGPTQGWAYSIDPTTKEQKEVKLQDSPKITKGSLLKREGSIHKIQKAMSTLCKKIEKILIDQLISQIIEETIQKHRLSNRKFITSEEKALFCREVDEKLERIINRTDYSEEMTLEDILGTSNEKKKPE